MKKKKKSNEEGQMWGAVLFFVSMMILYQWDNIKIAWYVLTGRGPK